MYGRIPPSNLPAFAPLVLACQPAVSGSDEVKTQNMVLPESSTNDDSY